MWLYLSSASDEQASIHYWCTTNQTEFGSTLVEQARDNGELVSSQTGIVLVRLSLFCLLCLAFALKFRLTPGASGVYSQALVICQLNCADNFVWYCNASPRTRRAQFCLVSRAVGFMFSRHLLPSRQLVPELWFNIYPAATTIAPNGNSSMQACTSQIELSRQIKFSLSSSSSSSVWQKSRVTTVSWPTSHPTHWLPGIAYTVKYQGETIHQWLFIARPGSSLSLATVFSQRTLWQTITNTIRRSNANVMQRTCNCNCQLALPSALWSFPADMNWRRIPR